MSLYPNERQYLTECMCGGEDAFILHNPGWYRAPFGWSRCSRRKSTDDDDDDEDDNNVSSFSTNTRILFPVTGEVEECMNDIILHVILDKQCAAAVWLS